jgi:hypothetical protein
MTEDCSQEEDAVPPSFVLAIDALLAMNKKKEKS